MKFRYERWNPFLKKGIFTLVDRNWNDFGYYTTFELYYCSSEDNVQLIGDVKILNKKEVNISRILYNKGDFDKLDSDFVSLGQSREYYENLGKIPYDKRKLILENIRDYSVISNFEKQEFYNLDGFANSLLREWTASYLLENATNIMANASHTLHSKEFIYKTKLEGAESEHIIDFDFTPKGLLPYRNFVLIGKNGVGKTKVLENLILDILSRKKEAFENIVPEYKKIILFYYGSDLEYDRLRENRSPLLEKVDIKSIFNEDKDLMIIESKSRKEYLKRLLRELMSENINLETLKPNEQLSSGQEIIYKLLIKILSKIEEETLIVIDEPETHLHPNIIGRLMTFIRGILDDFISHSIMSTHSPIILQQTPSRNVRVIKRQNNIPSVSNMHMECLGENLTEITREIFEVANFEDDYKLVLKKLKERTKNEKEILELFNGKLSFNAKIYLSSLCSDDNDEKRNRNQL